MLYDMLRKSCFIKAHCLNTFIISSFSPRNRISPTFITNLQASYEVYSNLIEPIVYFILSFPLSSTCAPTFVFFEEKNPLSRILYTVPTM